MESIKLFSNLKQKCGLGTQKTPLLDTRTLAGSARRCRRRLGPGGCCTEGWEVFLHLMLPMLPGFIPSQSHRSEPQVQGEKLHSSGISDDFSREFWRSGGGRPEVPNPALSKPEHVPKNVRQDPKPRFVLQTYLCLLWSGFLLITGD